MISVSAPTSGNAARPYVNALKAQQQQTWAAGDYAQVGSTLQIVGEALAETADVRPGQRVLDVAAGNGNFSLAAARRFAAVTSTDFVAQLLEKGRIRALAEGYDIRFQQADAEALPMADNSFDMVASVFGVMFTPDHHRVAGEMQRVCTAGGKIALANWTPDGFIGELFKIVGRYRKTSQDSAAAPSPMLWGTVDHLHSIFDVPASNVHTSPGEFVFRYHSPERWLQFFKQVYGPVRQAFAALDADTQADLHATLLSMLHHRNTATDGTLHIPGAYLQVVVHNH